MCFDGYFEVALMIASVVEGDDALEMSFGLVFEGDLLTVGFEDVH